MSTSKQHATTYNDTTRTGSIATGIQLRAIDGKADALAELLTGAGALVKNTEPGTARWYALRLNEHDFMIFDTFSTESGRAAHFEGCVAATLKAKAETLVEGGWESGVVANIANYNILSSNQ